MSNGKESDTIKTSSKEAQNEQGIHLRESGERNDGKDTGGQVSAVEGNARQNQGRRKGGAEPRDSESASLSYDGKEVSAKSLGIKNGLESGKVRLVAEGSETASMKEAKRIAAEHGLNVTFFGGGNLKIASGQKIISARAYIQGNNVYIRADHSGFTADQLMRHEAGHDMIAKGEVNVADVRKLINERFTPEEIDAISNAYAIAYADTGLTSDEIWEEVICDSVAEMNVFEGIEGLEASAEMAADFLPDLREATLESRKEATGPPKTQEGKASSEFGDYTKEEYENFGWVRANNILSAGYWKNFTENFADAVANKHYFPKAKNGEFMIEAYNVYDSEGAADVIVFASGTIESPNVTKIIKIDSDNFQEIEYERREILEAERRGIQQKAGELFGFYYKTDFIGELRNKRISSTENRNSGGLDTKRRTSEIKANRIVKFHVDEVNKTITITYANGETVTESLGKTKGKASQDLFEDMNEGDVERLNAETNKYFESRNKRTTTTVQRSKGVGSDSEVQHAQGSPESWNAERIEGGKATTAKPISEIIEQIRHDFGINITRGHVRGKNVLGQYNKRDHGIRTKIANDLPTVAHELGHALDQKYGLTGTQLSKQMRSELINALGDLKNAYKQNLWVSEGLAEYVRRFLQNRDDAARTYPEFTRHFLNSLSKADRVLIDTFADEINAYYALDGDTATSSIRLREEGVPDARTPLEKAREMGDDIYQAWVDANHGIRLFDEATGANTYKLASNAAYSDAIAGQIITGDLTDANGQYVAPGLKAALEGVNIGDKKIYREFGEYLVLKHGPERLNEGMRIFADERKNNAAFMEKRAGELEAAHPEFKEAADRLYTFQKQFLQTWAFDTGLLPSEVVEEWAKRWSFYVPLNRAVGKAGTVGAKRGYANQNSTIKKAIGSGLDIVHPVDNIINNIVKMVNVGVRNNVMLEITAQAKAVGADATFLEEVPTPMKKKTADLTGVKAKLHDAFGAAGIGELLAEVEGKIETQARASGQASRVSFQNTRSGMAHEKLFAYDEDLSRIIKEHGDIIIDNYEKLREVVDLAFDQPNKKATAYLGSIDPDTLQQILSSIPNLPSEYRDTLFKTGRNYSIAMTLDSIRHIVDDKHLTRADVLNYLDKLSETILSFDSVAFDVYTDSFGKKTPGLLFKKKFPDGTLISFNLVSNKKKSISLQTLYLNRADYENKRSAETLLMQNTSAHTPKARVGQTSSNNSISHKTENVNKKNSTNSESKKTDAWSKVDEIIESAIDDVLIQYGQGKAHGDIVTVLRNGKQEFWKINDALLLESLTNLSQKKMNGIMEAYAVVSRFMTANITGNNIIWSIFSNFPRDMMTFFTYSKQKNPLKAFPAMGEAYLNKVTGGNAETKNLPYIKEYYALGGGQTSAYTADVDLAKRARKNSATAK